MAEGGFSGAKSVNLERMMVDESVGLGATPGTMAGLAAWQEVVAKRDPAKLAELLADDVIFWSSIVHSAQHGKDLAMLYLSGAMAVLGNDSFTYVRELADGPAVVLEFTSSVDGITINGVDMIEFDDQGKIVDFKVMLRPLKAINLVQAQMAAMLAIPTSSPTSAP